jgi:uncharacterized membrane protein
MILSVKGQKWLKFIHLFFAILWTGGAFSLVLTLSLLEAKDPLVAKGIHLTQKMIDDFVVIPGAMGCLITGIFYATMTRWGWFQHRWLIAKWVITLGGILFGTFYLGPRLNPLHELVAATDQISSQLYLLNLGQLRFYGLVQLTTVIAASFLTIFKPWKPIVVNPPRIDLTQSPSN